MSFPYREYWMSLYPEIHPFIENLMNEVENVVNKNQPFPLDEMSQKIFGFTTKKTKRLLLKHYFSKNSFDENLILKTHVLSVNCKCNHDLLFNLLENKEQIDNKKPDGYIIKMTPSLYKRLLKFYNEKRILSLLFNNEDKMFEDLNRMFIILENKDFKNWHFLPKKPKSLMEIHDCLSRIISRLSFNDYELNQREDVLKLDNVILERNNLKIKVPQKHSDLVYLGEALNFCIGNGYYSKLVKNEKCSIIGLFDKNGPVYGIQFSRYRIMEARGFGNSTLPASILNELGELLLSVPKLPNDFIGVVHSFIKGYKYDNVNLYVMFNNGSVYLYEDVPEEEYEEFVNADSRGSYFSRIIKKKYHCEKIYPQTPEDSFQIPDLVGDEW